MAATVVALVAGGIAACGGAAAQRRSTRLSAKQIVERSKPAIVRVETGDDRVGTGFALDPSGLIATNLHVVAGTTAIRVRLLDGTAYDVVRLAAVDADRDLAILDIDPPSRIPVLTLGDSDKVAAGDPVVAIGNPLGVLDYTVSDGLISSVRELSNCAERCGAEPEAAREPCRAGCTDLTVLQISAPISQGSSGGPLFNPYGEVIGVATAIFTAGQNLNFAVPSNYLRTMMKRRTEISLEEFAAFTKVPSGAEPPSGDGSAPRIERRIPRHDLAVLDGCDQDSLAEVLKGISDAIEIGAPLYNQGNHEACYRVYEGTAMRFEREGACRGVREAFGNGLLRASTLDTYTAKAWALRDTFDGLLEVMLRRSRGPSSKP